MRRTPPVVLAVILVAWCMLGSGGREVGARGTSRATIEEELLDDAVGASPARPAATPAVARSPAPTDDRPPVPDDAGDRAWGAVELLRRTIAPGDKRRLAFQRTNAGGENLLDVPVLVVRGERAGPTLCLTAGIHGDELNGVEITRHVFEHTQPDDLEGMLVALPVINMHGFRTGSRYVASQRDLNRAFPGTTTGSAVARMAHGLFVEIIRHCDALIDFHTGSLQRANLPQIRADLSRAGVQDLALAFGVEIVLDGRGPAGSLRAAAVEVGTPAILYEAGEPLRFQDVEIAYGVEGVRNVMAHLEMMPDPGFSRRSAQVFRRTHWVRAEADGIFRSDRTLGDVVGRGEVLGTITDPATSARTRIVAPHGGRIVGMAVPQVVLSGFALFHIGTVEQEPTTR